MSSTMKLSALEPGAEALVCALPEDGLYASRLMELGFYPGARIQSLFTAVFGDPCAYSVQSAVIALRRSETEKISIKPI